MKKLLTEAGLQASAARLAIADFVLHTQSHPTAEEVRDEVEQRMPSVSLATIYNTLNLFVEKGLLAVVRDPLSEALRYDCNTKPHFHFYDESTGELMDLEPDLIRVSPNLKRLNEQYEIRGIDVTVRGKKRT